MASTIRNIVDGPKTVVVSVITGGTDVTDEAILTPSSLNADPILGYPTALVIEKLSYTGSLYCLLEWDATTDSPAIAIGANAAQPCAAEWDFTEFGGLKDPLASGYTGIIQLTTLGAGVSRASTFELTCRKIY